jgi:electron transport complex protein RnfB
MLIDAALTIGSLALLAGLLLTLANRQLPADSSAVVEQINQLLPQTQCAQCGYPGCRPYAEAIAGDLSDINRCPPGGDELIQQLAGLLGREPRPLASELAPAPVASVAFILEDLCIGCTYCIDACPVDAIVGARNLMHTVVARECTGCELCLPPCPVDCIEMRALP